MKGRLTGWRGMAWGKCGTRVRWGGMGGGEQASWLRSQNDATATMPLRMALLLLLATASVSAVGSVTGSVGAGEGSELGVGVRG